MTFLTERKHNHDLFPSWMDFDRFDNFFNIDPWTTGLEHRPQNKYRWDETEDVYTIDIVMPGMTKKDIDITFKNEMLTVKCKKEVSEKDQRFLGVKTEQSFKNFPSTICSNSISAEMNDGVLTIILPKREADKPKTIDIK